MDISDPLVSLKRISNPYSVGLYKKDKKRILLLGDLHLPNVKECKSCERPTCSTYLGIINDLDKYHKTNGTNLDVFIEVVAPDNSKSIASKIAASSYTYSNSFLLKPLHLIKTRTSLINKLYFHNSDENIRYHYIDLRFSSIFKKNGFDIIKLIQYDSKYLEYFKERYPSKQKIISVVKDLCFGAPFDPKFKPRSYLNNGKTKIAKQFYKLQDKDQKLLRSFLNERMDIILNNTTYPDTWHVIFYTMLLMTDIYAISRFIRFFNRQVEGSTSVFLAGFAHKNNYRLFLEKWGATKIFDSHPTIDFIGNYTGSELTKMCKHVDFSKI